MLLGRRDGGVSFLGFLGAWAGAPPRILLACLSLVVALNWALDGALGRKVGWYGLRFWVGPAAEFVKVCGSGFRVFVVFTVVGSVGFWLQCVFGLGVLDSNSKSNPKPKESRCEVS